MKVKGLDHLMETPIEEFGSVENFRKVAYSVEQTMKQCSVQIHAIGSQAEYLGV